MDDIELRVKSLELVLAAYAQNPGTIDNTEEVLEECAKTFNWLRHGKLPEKTR